MENRDKQIYMKKNVKKIIKNFQDMRTEMSIQETIPVKVTRMHLRTLERMYGLEDKSCEKNPKAFAIALKEYKKKNQMEKWAYCIEIMIKDQCYQHVRKEFEKIQNAKK